MKRFVFTFGTLYEPKIITALLGSKPPSFLATLHGYSVFEGNANDLSSEIKTDIASKRDLSNFSFLFAKKTKDNSVIEEKVYELTASQELTFDWWERYPKWYLKRKPLL